MKKELNEFYRGLPKKDKLELEFLGKKLSEYVNRPVRDKNLKKIIARACLKLINETPNEKTSIMETSYLITGFFFKNDYGDNLDDVFNLAGELELPEEHLSDNIFKLWEKMNKILGEYIK